MSTNLNRDISRNRLVLASANLKSRTLKNLAEVLSKRLGYHVYRVTPERILGRKNFTYLMGIDKITQLRAFEDKKVSSPEWCTYREGVSSFSSTHIVARALTRASEGRGITIFEKGSVVPYAPLYTAYIPKKKEFRVHVYNNAVIDVAEKRKNSFYNQERDTRVRNTSNGYVFCRSDLVEPEELRLLAISACQALGRRYGAVDIIWNKKHNKCYVLEVNSRPGMEGTTLTKYADAILKELYA